VIENRICEGIDCLQATLSSGMTSLHKAQNIVIDTTDQNLHRHSFTLLFLRSVSILSCCPIINICGGHKDLKVLCVGRVASHPHTGFHYCKLDTLLSYGYGSFSNISVMDLGGCGYRQVRN
jgi:gamma-glutamyl-gamma-aminobutyrate hydrolase PuuD